MRICPCKDCPDVKAECKTNCPHEYGYKEWKAEQEEWKRIKDANKAKDSITISERAKKNEERLMKRR